MSIGANLNNLSCTLVNGVMTHAIGAAMDRLQSLIGNGGRDRNCKFYYSSELGGSVLQVFVKETTSFGLSELKNEVTNEFNSLFNKKSKNSPKYVGLSEEQKDENKKYGHVNVGDNTVYALDDWGGICTDALMLVIKTEKPVTIHQSFPVYDQNFGDIGRMIADGQGENSEQKYKRYGDPEQKYKQHEETIVTNHLVWYDTTALITINSDKNVVITKVQGRDYSRKELVSNGDIKFSVTGQMTSGKPDIYPTNEVKKFIEIMQYKGIIHINNQILDQFGIEDIVITDFSLSPKEGYKASQSYTFSAIGLQPEKEADVTEDTVIILPPDDVETNDTDSVWVNMLQNQLEELKNMSQSLFSQGAALGTGAIDGFLNRTL